MPATTTVVSSAMLGGYPRAELPSIGLVVPCRNEARYIDDLLDAIRAQDCAADEVIVVDGGSTDGTLQALQSFARRYPDFPLRILTIQGATISVALNTAIEIATSEVIVRIDGHSRPAPDYLRRTVTALAETNAATVGGIWHIRPGAPSGMAVAIAKAVTHPIGAGDALYRLGHVHGRRSVDTVAFGAFRRSHWQNLGGYNEDQVLNEDYEFNYRTRQSGGDVILDSAIRCEYFARPTLGALARQYFRYGWWKGRMLLQHPRSLRIRQAIPAAFLPSWLVLAALALLVPSARLTVATLLVAYSGLLVIGGLHAARGQWRLVPRIAATFLTIHTTWSAGIISFALTRLLRRTQRDVRRNRLQVKSEGEPAEGNLQIRIE